MKVLQTQGSDALTPQREIIRIKASIGAEIAKPLLARYARVSSDSTDQLDSFSAQVRYCTKLIESRSEWEVTGVYADEDTSGVSNEKP